MRVRGGWWQSLSLAVLAAGLRLIDLGTPHAVVFDETYYVKDAWSLLHSGYERQAVTGADELMLAGQTDILQQAASYVVHPPFGKWVIAVGEHFFGLNPFGWRFAVALLGIAAVVLVHRIARRLFHNEWLAWLAGLFIAVDGLAIVMSRTALLDQTLMATTLSAFWCVVADRDRSRARLESGRGLGFRWHILLAAVLLGLAMGSKWSAAWFVVAIGILLVFVTARVRIGLGHARAWTRALLLDTLPYLPLVVLLFAGTYLATWSGWLLTSGGYDRNFAAGSGWGQALASLLEYHRSAWGFHVNLTSPHSYSANPWTWPLQLRPTSFYYESFKNGQSGCTVESCSAEVLALGNPLIWWAGALALLHQLWRAIVRRETRATLIVLMFCAGWLPWMMYQQRTVFSFYSIVMLPFVCLALAASIGTFMGAADAPGRERSRSALVTTGFVFAVVVVSALFLPLWTGQTIPYGYWLAHMIFSSWI